MREYAKVAVMGMLMTGLLAVPNLSPAAGSSSQNGNDRHRLLNAELRSKIEHLRDKMGKHHQHESVPGSLEALQTEVASLKTDLAAMAGNEATLLSQLSAANATISTFDARLKVMEAKATGSTNPVLTELAKYVTVEKGELAGVKGPHLVLTGVNLHVRSGRNATNDGGALSGLGNLIVGYNEAQSTPVVYDGEGCDRTLTGSHNIVTGTGNLFTSYGGVVVGSNHCLTSPNSSILAGDTNEAHGLNSAILGGTRRGTSAQNQTVPIIK
jgi:hypothetical protein